MSTEIENLKKFISEEKDYFKSIKTNINWDDIVWKTNDWLFHRGENNTITFDAIKRIKLPKESHYILPKGILPEPYINFVKALAVHQFRTKKIGFMAVRNYIIECRRLFIIMAYRNEVSPTQLTRWHFEETLQLLIDSNYKNLYDAATNLQAIAEKIDQLKITYLPIEFKHSISQNHRNHEVKSIRNIDDNERKDKEKLPSYEAMQAYALATNNPINDNEEILLRTIDLLIAMGQRGNEVTVLPLDCWVEKIMKSKSTGEYITDGNGNYIKKIGIRYFAEKQFTSRVHWLADQDVPLAKRAYERLVKLTEEAREVALWQENNPGKIWDLNSNDTIDDDSLIKYLNFNRHFNLQVFTKKNNVPVYSTTVSNNRKSYFEQGRWKNYYKNHHYLIKDIESVIIPYLSDHIVLKENINGSWKTILKTSETLSIAFKGAFSFKKRGNHLLKVFPIRLQIKDINAALGSIEVIESIFERRNLKEADGSRIVMTSHQPRHWRNTLYELAGMSNVQQALAMGRARLDQNPTYQHTTIKERTEFHKDFIAFNSITEKVSYLQNGIRDKKILGSITDTYHYLKEEKGLQNAEDFLNTHALAIHITPFGGCTHDFSQSPCLKHLQCWNGCSHLHRTNTPGETERIKEQLESSLIVLEKMKADSDDYGKDAWIKDLEKKIENLQKGLRIQPSNYPTQIFPDGVQITIPLDYKPKSSV